MLTGYEIQSSRVKQRRFHNCEHVGRVPARLRGLARPQSTNAPTSIWLVDPDAAVPFQKLVELPVRPRFLPRREAAGRGD